MKATEAPTGNGSSREEPVKRVCTRRNRCTGTDVIKIRLFLCCLPSSNPQTLVHHVATLFGVRKCCHKFFPPFTNACTSESAIRMLPSPCHNVCLLRPRFGQRFRTAIPSVADLLLSYLAITDNEHSVRFSWASATLLIMCAVSSSANLPTHPNASISVQTVNSDMF